MNIRFNCYWKSRISIPLLIVAYIPKTRTQIESEGMTNRLNNRSIEIGILGFSVEIIFYR